MMLSECQESFQDWHEVFTVNHLDFLQDEFLGHTFNSVTFNEEVWNKASNQPEEVLSLAEYFDLLISNTQLECGFEKLHSQSANLKLIRDSGISVNKEVLVAIWGIETRYGAIRGDLPVLDALATNAVSKPSRQKFFEDNLLAAMKILQSGIVSKEQLLGSWAGAMGHTQFMPATYLAFGLDIQNKGKVDIWEDDPLDALASTANYLLKNNWNENKPIVSEILHAECFDYMMANSGRVETVSFWASQGIKFAHFDLDPNLRAEIITPSGHNGPKFALFENFKTILAYNPSKYYALAVGYLANLLSGETKLISSWPLKRDYLSRNELKTVQTYLVKMGYDTGGIDGLLGPKSIASVQRYQNSLGLIPDGFPDRGLLEAIGAAKSK